MAIHGSLFKELMFLLLHKKDCMQYQELKNYKAQIKRVTFAC